MSGENPNVIAPLQTLTSAYLQDAPYGTVTRPVVGMVGQDVPVELIWAAGARHLRLRGNPQWDRSEAEFYLGRGVDAATTSLFAGILNGVFGPLDAIVVSSDCDASQRLYYAMREMRRVAAGPTLPPIYLVDMLHLPRNSTARYNRARLGQFVGVLQDWFGVTLTTERISGAIGLSRRILEAQRRFTGLRLEDPTRVSGEQALAVYGAGSRMEPEGYLEALEGLLAAAEVLPGHPGRRIFLTGSSHDRPDVYNLIESAGSVIVGEDHDHGQLSTERPLPDPGTGDPLDILALAYRDNGPTPQRASIPNRAAHTARAARLAGAELVLSYIRNQDEAPLWDFAAQRGLIQVPTAVLRGQPYGSLLPEALAHALSVPSQTGVSV